MSNASITVADVAAYLEEWAPPSSAQSYDNVGLQIGDPASPVTKSLIALDMTPEVLEEASTLQASLIITHHPLIFKPLTEITPRNFVTNLVLRLAQTRIALYSIHTNLDVAPGGVSFFLGEALGLSDLTFLAPLDGAEAKAGLGAVGRLADPLSLDAFLELVSTRLGAGTLRYVGDASAGKIERVAVCGGAGSDFIDQALASGADAYVTSDVKYHRFFDALSNDGRPRIVFVDAGHYETEVFTVNALREHLSVRFPSVEWYGTRKRTSPVRSFARATIRAENER